MPNPTITLLAAVVLMAVTAWLFWPESGFFWRWRHDRQLTERVLLEDALKTIYQNEIDVGEIQVKQLAYELEIPVSQAEQVIHGLQTRRLLELQAGNLRLTPPGNEYALRVIRAHRLYERYLADETGYKESEWHTKAHDQEHNLSPEQVAELSARLGNPIYDPHGDPIPDAEGYLPQRTDEVLLTEIGIGKPARIVHLEDEPATVYAQLVAEGLLIGQEVKLLEVSPQRVRFWGDGDEHILAPQMAANISVVPILEENHQQATAGEALTRLKPGQAGRVLHLSPRIRGVERRRLMDLGLLPGTVITTEMVSAGGNPTAYRIRGAVIALRKSQTDQIFVSPQEN